MIHGKSLEAWCASHPLIRDPAPIDEQGQVKDRLAQPFGALNAAGDELTTGEYHFVGLPLG